MRLVVIFYLFVCVSFGQSLKGSIVDSKTGEPIVNASVYFDGTSIGTVSDIDGKFKLNKRSEITADLIITIIGYNKIRIKNPYKANLEGIKLSTKTNVLDEVVIVSKDPWSRQKKVGFFKDQFLGSMPWARKCEIPNIDKVRLRFNPKTQMLTAVCDEPIIVINKHLGYEILYDLTEFQTEFDLVYNEVEKVNYGAVTTEKVKEYLVKRTFYLGSSFFTELEDINLSETRRKRRREKAYLLSSLRFFRALTSNSLKDQKYSLFYESIKINPEEHITSDRSEDLTQVDFKHTQYDLVVNKKYKSIIMIDGESLINDYGIILTPFSIQFGGYMSKIKISGLLPLEYGLQKKRTNDSALD